jgi:hypothetical protein
MSLATLANDLMRQSPAFRANAAASLAAVPAAEAALPADIQRVQTAANERAIQDNKATSVVNVLTKYIPTESVTLYVAAIAAAPALHSQYPWLTTKVLYWAFGLLTPILWLLIYVAKRKGSDLPSAWPSLSAWLVWALVASFVAFLVWALAVPNGPYMQGQVGGVIAGFLAVLISTLLSVVELVIPKQP